ncbi:ComC/BlpC family leader-containing pheromone/bacteriocin [Dysgonomonas sp. GY617]|nr:ComC/BlpC family leader-containing pheromone/bacteriocin [Dysgonomonas sp. GY617]MBF0576065.1 ComC/BlpC family leader-containing pheromone/bacteriocin [Dysgonomonas sp. GY617]
MKKKSIKNFKKLENKDLKKIKGGEIHYVWVGDEWMAVDYPS